MLNIEPSNVKLLNWSFLPPKDPPEAEGSKRVKSDADLDIVGNTFKSLVLILVCAPVLSLLKTAFLPELITTSSKVLLSSDKTTSIFEVLPKVKKIFVILLDLKPR